jgi:multiple sugar transport system permease protein
VARADSEHVAGWAFVTPATVLIGIFGLLPIGWSLLLSFQHSDLLTPETPWVGTRNYRQLVHDPTFAAAVGHTLLYSALFVPATMVVGVLVAAALNRRVRGISL